MKWRQDTRQIRNDSNGKHYLMMVQCIRQGMHGKFSYFFVNYLLLGKKTQIILLWHKAYFAASSKWPNCIFSRKITFSCTFLNVANGNIHWVKRSRMQQYSFFCNGCVCINNQVVYMSALKTSFRTYDQSRFEMFTLLSVAFQYDWFSIIKFHY